MQLRGDIAQWIARLGWIGVALACGPATAYAAKHSEVTIAKGASNEQTEREVDQVAMSAQDMAISRLLGLQKKYRGSAQEAGLLEKLADFQQQRASILFRIAHGQAHRQGKLDLTKYKKAMALSIEALDRLIAKYPDFEELDHAWFLRGKAYEEMEKKPEAERNYLHLVRTYPNSLDSTKAYMSLAEFAIQANDHARAITFLKEVEKRPEDPQFPFALYKLAWAHYNLKSIPQALAYAERQIKYYNDRKSPEDTGAGALVASSDQALKENTLLDVAVFYFEGYEEKLDAYALKEALPYFKRLDDGPILGKILLRFAKLLRSHSHEMDLLAWKDQILESQSRFPESLDVLILTYEYQLNNHKYERVMESAGDMARLYAAHPEYESFPKAQKQILDTAEGLQKLIVKNKGASEVKGYSQLLARIYDAFVKMVKDSDPRIPRVHYNLAETLFTIQDYAGASENYRWVVDHGRWPSRPDGELKAYVEASVPDASLKAIGAYYEVLRARGLIPKELTARAIPASRKDEVEPALGQWVDWLDRHMKFADLGTETFAFEATRALYGQGAVQRAIERMTASSMKHPKSKYAVPAASLVLDTYIASADWEKTHAVANEFREVPEWKKGDFAVKLLAVASDALYKQLELKFRAHDYKVVLKGCDQFFTLYPKSDRLGDVLALAGTSAIEAIDRPRALGYFSRLIKEVPKSPHVTDALLTRASIQEDMYLFAPAARDLHAYIGVKQGQAEPDQKKLQDLRKKVLMLTWLAGDSAALRATLGDKSACPESLAEECEKYAILDQLGAHVRERSEDETQAVFEKARKAENELRALWAAVALEGAKHLAFRDRFLMVRHFSANWEKLDPLVKFALIPHVSHSLTHAFQLNRLAMKDVAPLRADEKWITRRVEVIREMENAATKVMKMPWSRIRAGVLNEVAGVYLDLSRGLAALPPPKNLSEGEIQAYNETIAKLTLPFEEKGQDMRLKAFEIGSRFAIEDPALALISEPFFQENPSQAKALQALGSKLGKDRPAELDLAFLDRVDGDGKWTKIRRALDEKLAPELALENPAFYIKSLWARAVQARNLPQIGFFMQEAQEKALIQAGVMASVKAVSLAAVGARGEGLAELEEARKDLPPSARTLITRQLMLTFINSLSKERSEGMQKELDELEGRKVDRLVASDAKKPSATPSKKN